MLVPQGVWLALRFRLIVVAVKLLHTVYAMLKHRQPLNASRLLVAPTTLGA